MNCIDVHAHIVPGIDDGSKSNQESSDMLKMAYETGVTTVIATPHYAKGFSDYTSDELRRYCKALEKHAQAVISPEFRVFPGQEIFFNEKSLEKIRQGEVITLADSRYILLEFAPEISYSAMYQGLREIAMTAYYPVLAHVERYACLRDFGRIEELRGLGVMIQMNYSHIAGKWYDENTRWCRRALKEQLVDVLGTDMHNSSDKGPRMQAALDWMTKHLDEHYLLDITSLNAQTIIG